MTLWTVMDIDTLAKPDGSGIVRLQLSDGDSIVVREMALAEATALRRQIEDLSKTNPGTTSAEARIEDEVLEIDLESARSFLGRLPQDQPSTSSMTRRRIPLIAALAVILALLAGWGATYLMLRSSIEASNIEMIEFAGRIVQAPRGSPALLNQAMEMLAKDASIPISPERRRQLVQVLAKYPETSLETLIELYGAEFPEFNLLAERLKTYGLGKAIEAAGPNDASPDASIAGAQKPESGSAPSQQPTGKEVDRLPEEDEPGGMKESSKAVNPAPPEMDKEPSPVQ